MAVNIEPTLSSLIAGRVLQALLPEAVVMASKEGYRWHVSTSDRPADRFDVLFADGQNLIVSARDLGAMRVADVRDVLLSFVDNSGGES